MISNCSSFLGSAARCARTGARGGLLVFALLCGLAPRQAAAQPPDPTRLQAELERTNRMLEHATEVVTRSGNPRALEVLQMARRQQGLAWDLFRQQRPVLSAQATLRARERLREALRLAGRELDFERQSARLLDDAARALEHARECAGDRPPPPVQHRLDLAVSQLEQARRACREQRFRVCADITAQALRMLQSLCDAGALPRPEMLLENVRRLLERAGAGVQASGDRDAVVMLDRARDLLERAERLCLAGNPEAAVRLADQARELILEAMRRTERPPDVAQVDRLLQDTGRYVEDLARQVHSTGNPEATTLMARAQAHVERARDLRLGDRLREALAEMRVARNLARRAGQLAGIRQP